MRSTLLAILASVAIVSATGCAQDNIEELAARATCGRSDTIAKCLRAAVDLARLEDVEWCYEAGGCEVTDATAEAVSFTHDCRAFEAQEAEKELKKRQDSSSAKSTTAKAKSSTAKSTTASVASTSDTTTAESSTTSASVVTTSATTVASTTSTSTDSTSTSASTGTAASAHTTGPLVCSVTSTVSTTQCSVSAGKTISCYPTTTAIASCAPGVICFESSAGTAAVCMRRDNSLSTSGLVVTIVFAFGIVFTIICFVVHAIQAKSKAKKEASDRLLAAANSGRSKDAEAANAFSSGRNAGASDSNLPLMTPGGPRSETYAAGQQDYFGHGQQGAPRLNPGLGALGQERY